MREYRLVLELAAAAAVLAMLSPAMAQDKPLSFVYMAASSQNGYNEATWRGVQAAAADLGNVEVQIMDGEFNKALQFSQAEDITASGKYDGFVVAPEDPVGIATAVADAIEANLLVATVLFPLGPSLTTMDPPQVPGLVTTAALNPEEGARAQADAVVEFCADEDPCKVAVLIGNLTAPFDNLRYETYEKVFGDHPNITIVATGEGKYSPDVSLTAMQDILQSHPDLNVVLSNADQHLMGALIAFEDAGIDPDPIYLMGGGLSQITIEEMKAGRIDASLANFPYTEGYYALKSLVQKARGEELPTWVDPSKMTDIPAIVTKEWIKEHPDQKAEWEG